MSQPDDGVRIGLEVHVYLRTESKLFCPCRADFLESPRANSQVCHVCTGQPGAKPLAPNAAAMRAAVRLARALGAHVRPRTRILRKHYFYPDSPANYQRTSEPVATGGSLLGVRLTELHVEEDPGAYDLATGHVDYDRAGAPLIELVTEPDLGSPAHARRFLHELRLALQYLGIGRDEAGVKADCNVSLAGGERVEVKNVNSARNVERALQHEIDRQRALVAKDGRVARETRGFDEATGATVPLRTKETEADYRFLADPDVAPVDLDAVAASIPAEESPYARRARIAQAAGVAEEDASPLLEERALAEALDALASRADPRVAFQFLLRDVRAELDYRRTTLAASRVRVDELAGLVAALHEGRITPQVATRLLRQGLDTGGLQEALSSELSADGGGGGSDVLAAAREALAGNPKAVSDYRAGKGTAVNFLVGQTMRRLQGRADAAVVRAAVEQALREAI